MTDERAGDALWEALARLPRGAGVVFRHHGTPPAARRVLLRRVFEVARRLGLHLVVAGEAYGLNVGGHNRRARSGLVTRSAHSRGEAIAAARAGADAIFVSPVFATRSHPGAAPIGVSGFAQVARTSTGMAIALGGMDARRFRLLRRHGAHGWGAIDALTVTKRERKRG